MGPYSNGKANDFLLPIPETIKQRVEHSFGNTSLISFIHQVIEGSHKIKQNLTYVVFMSYSTLDKVSKLVPNFEYFSFNFQLKNAATKFCFLGHLHANKVP